jgi:hypothetical protein
LERPRARKNMHMEIRMRELHYRWIDTPSEPFTVDEVPNPEPPPHPQPTDPPPTAQVAPGSAPPGSDPQRAGLIPGVRT